MEPTHPTAHPPRRRHAGSSVLADVVVVVCSLLLCLVGLYGFAASFFLAKRTVTTRSRCGDAPALLRRYLNLTPSQVDAALAARRSNDRRKKIRNDGDDDEEDGCGCDGCGDGCWTDRRVDAVVILLVDALRFDFALYDLPRSIGTRLYLPEDEQHDEEPQDETTTTAATTSINGTTTTTTQQRKAGAARRRYNTRLYRFVADPPTVTMQRLKALTTGGLPTFADLSLNFGGATIEEDSWLYQQVHQRRRRRMGFVGDDTWMDLYPTMFDTSYPYPSFNTRDIDTVDYGCFQHIPEFVRPSRRQQSASTSASTTPRPRNDSDYEVTVIHFLGVDHVGHTYGPHNRHMDRKLRQIDGALAGVLDAIDDDGDGPNRPCRVALIFGDHGMTPDGNHGGGTDEEINAALFVHASPGCTARTSSSAATAADGASAKGGLFASSHSSSSTSTTTSMTQRLLQNLMLEDHNQNQRQPQPSSSSLSSSSSTTTAFASIHQIDLVPTISMMLGLPIPYANLGSLVPSLIPGLLSERGGDPNDRHRRRRRGPKMELATMYALNAAQVWRYYTTYSSQANPLPNLPELQRHLQTATDAYRQALDEYQQHQHHPPPPKRKATTRKPPTTNSNSTVADDDTYDTDAYNDDEAEWDEYNDDDYYYDDDERWEESAVLFQHFLAEALALGQRVWTRFDGVGMAGGIALLTVGSLLFAFGTPRCRTNNNDDDENDENDKNESQEDAEDDYDEHYPNTTTTSSMTTATTPKTPTTSSVRTSSSTTTAERNKILSWEVGLAAVFITFQCGILTFSNSYILEEEHCIMYFIALLSLAVAVPRLLVQQPQPQQLQQPQQPRPLGAGVSSWSSTTLLSSRPCWLWYGVILLPVASRLSELFVSGHGLDPSLGVHPAHNRSMFLSSLSVLIVYRCFLHHHHQQEGMADIIQSPSFATKNTTTTIPWHAVVDCLSMICLAQSWWEKSSTNIHQDGYLACRIAFFLLVLGLVIWIIQGMVVFAINANKDADSNENLNIASMKHQKTTVTTMIRPKTGPNEAYLITGLCKALIAIMAVTGPSTASTLVLYAFQITVLAMVSSVRGCDRGRPGVPPSVVAALLRFVTRHAFFATNHGCAFNRLQYSAAFVATDEFYFATGGISLFWNTFGWEIAGLAMSLLLSQRQQHQQEQWQRQHQQPPKQQQQQQIEQPPERPIQNSQYPDGTSIFRVYCSFQLLEATASCMSVSALRRHLMVWDVYAPHFVFVVIFTVLTALFQLTCMVLTTTAQL